MASKPRPAGPASRAGEIVARLRRLYPDAACTLDFGNPLQLLIATILSAQCTDERVNKVTPALFAKYASAADFANAEPDALMDALRPTGFFRNKTKAIQAACREIVDNHAGQVPRTLDELVALPGVGRKTANVVLGNAFGQAVGVVVDTHVARLSQRLGLSASRDPGKIEQDLMARVGREDWIFLSHALILHGRRICTARKPACGDCPLNDICPSAFSFEKRK